MILCYRYFYVLFLVYLYLFVCLILDFWLHFWSFPEANYPIYEVIDLIRKIINWPEEEERAFLKCNGKTYTRQINTYKKVVNYSKNLNHLCYFLWLMAIIEQIEIDWIYLTNINLLVYCVLLYLLYQVLFDIINKV